MDQLGKRKRWLILGGIVLLGLALRVAAFSLFDTIAHDEILQYQERAWRMVFGYGIVPWETRYGMRDLLIPDLLAAAMAAATMVSNNPWAAVITARVVFAGVCLASLPAAYALGRLRSPTHALVAMFAAAVWFEAVLFGVQVLSESIAVPFAVGGAAALLWIENGKEHDRGGARLAGFLLAITVLLRLQYVVFAGTLVLLTARADWRVWRDIVIGALPALVIGAGTDLAAGLTPFAWMVRNFSMNIQHSRADQFGVSGPTFYVAAIILRLLPLSPLLVVASIFAGRRYRPVLIAAFANIAVHSLIGHKEYRFIWLSVFVIVVLAAIASVDLLDRLRERRGAEPASGPLGVAGLCLGWTALSLASYFATGGFTVMRDGAKVAEASIRAMALPGTCGVAVTVGLRKPIAYTFLQRPVPLYLLSDAMDHGREALPATVADAANAIIVSDKAHLPANYRSLGCQQDVLQKVCLFHREGPCRNAAAANYNAYDTVVRLNDM